MSRIYFIQTQPSPTEGPHAQEVSEADFFASCIEYHTAPVETDGENLYLRLDLLEAQNASH